MTARHVSRCAGWSLGALVVAGALAVPAAAYEREIEGGALDGWQLQWRNRVSAGAAWRVQERKDSLIGKASLDPQLCTGDDCIALTENDTAPNERFLAAPGAISSNTDDGDLNYKKGDLVHSGARLASRLRLGTVDHGVELGAMLFHDPVNDALEQTHFNRIVEAGPQPGVRTRSRFPHPAREQVGHDLQLREANVYRFIDSWDEQPLELRLGRQVLTWGESVIHAQGTLDFVNPTDASALNRPGVEPGDLSLPQNMLVVRGPVRGSLSWEAFYQLEWRPYGLPARGSFYSAFDAGNEVTADDYAVALFAKAPEDPGQLGIPALPTAQRLTATSFSIRRAANREPRDGGQYGLALYWVLDEAFDSPVAVNLFHASYHSRLPAVSAYAAQAGCHRREGNALGLDAGNAVEFFAVCPVGVRQPGPATFDALPLETARYFLDYAEDIKLWGLSFDTEALDFAIQGELVFRQNQPLQIDLEDVLFTAWQPAFPRQTIPLALATLADSRRAIPNYLEAWRGQSPGETAPGSYVRGYERLKTLHGTLGFTRITGAGSWFHADEAVYLLEISANHIPGLPSLDALQFEGPGTHTHYSPGIADTGDALKINPVANGGTGYLTGFAYGYRLAGRLRYTDAFWQDFTLRPRLVFSHDVDGVGPGPAGDFVEGRKVIAGNVQGQYHRWRVDLAYSWFTGGGDANVLRDRDTFAVAVSYEF